MITFTIECVTEDHEQAVKDAIAILRYSLKASDAEVNPMDGSLCLMAKDDITPIAWLNVEEGE